MNERQAYALANVATDPMAVIGAGYARTRQHPRGFLLHSILAVDR
jgi:hypothetical protein